MLERTKQLMNMSVLDALVDGFEHIEKILTLPDPDDNHVLAAAIVSEADTIVTFNLRDFPHSYLNQYSIEAQHTDLFLMHLIRLDERRFLRAVKNTRLRLKNPPKTVAEYLHILKKQNLTKTVSFFRKVRKTNMKLKIMLKKWLRNFIVFEYDIVRHCTTFCRVYPRQKLQQNKMVKN